MTKHTNSRAGRTGAGARGWDAESNRTPMEPSAWLRGEYTRIAARPEVRAALGRGMQVLVPIWPGSAFAPSDVEDRTCDRCRTYVPMGQKLWVFKQEPEYGLTVLGALCTPCARREGWVA
jgi:hypothetical protein